jgi:hypothetical protein
LGKTKHWARQDIGQDQLMGKTRQWERKWARQGNGQDKTMGKTRQWTRHTLFLKLISFQTQHSIPLY